MRSLVSHIVVGESVEKMVAARGIVSPFSTLRRGLSESAYYPGDVVIWVI